MKTDFIASIVFRRTLIIGNAGSGKTWLARQLAEPLQLPIVHLDDLHWEPGMYGTARDPVVRDQLVRAAASEQTWLMEGVYGWLAKTVFNRVTHLVWIDLPEEECVANIKNRGTQGGEDEEQFIGLIKWVSEYRIRTNNWNSFEAHSKLFSVYPLQKIRLHSRKEISLYIEAIQATLLRRG
ncbi:ATPase AAA [Labrenzia sp. DG1229]|uniref:ATPase AAA n=1 Tax=Labrenzia sp. DG1229 TaxID=681847 RepID=UPI00048EE276|nr:ATPase AAA [Labrenzia sp. DG1229]